MECGACSLAICDGITDSDMWLSFKNGLFARESASGTARESKSLCSSPNLLSGHATKIRNSKRFKVKCNLTSGPSRTRATDERSCYLRDSSMYFSGVGTSCYSARDGGENELRCRDGTDTYAAGSTHVLSQGCYALSLTHH